MVKGMMAAVLACLLLLGSAPGAALYEQGVSLIDGVDAGARLGAALVAEAATLRNGPGALYDKVATVWEGQALRYLDTMDGWVRVETPAGRRGWLEGSSVALWDLDMGGAYAVRPGRWRVTAPDGAGGGAASDPGAPEGGAAVAGAVLEEGAPGVLTLAVEGRGLDRASVTPGPSLVAVGAAADWRGHLKVGARGVETITVSGSGIVLKTRGPAPAAEVLEQGASRLVVELRPRVDAVVSYLRDSAQVYHIAMAGAPRPVTWTGDDGRAVYLQLPGARLGDLALPDGVTAGQDDEGVTLRFASARQYAVRATPGGGLDLVLHAPGLAGRVIVLDPGHGGSETGAVSPYTGMAEKTVNLDVARRLRDLLEARGASVVLTRTSDTHVIADSAWAQVPRSENPNRADLHERVRMAEAAGADLLLSIHHNAGEGSGAEMYYARENLNAERAETLAHMLQAEFVDVLGRRDRGAQPEVFYVTRFAPMPAVLTEGGYMTDPGESLLLASPAYRQREAESMADVVERYFQDRYPYNGASAAELGAALKGQPQSEQRYAAYVQAEVALGLHRDYDLFVLGSKAAVNRRPVVREGQALVPLSALEAPLGLTVQRSDDAVEIRRGAARVAVTAGLPVALADGRPVELGATPVLEDGEFMVPVRLVAEHLGYAVTWLDHYRTIVITDGPLE